MKPFQHGLSFIIILVSPLYFSGCASLGPTKPNLPFAGNHYPSVLIELAEKNPLLVQELGKLPELQNGITQTEAPALRDIVELYNADQAHFEKAFHAMYKIGLPEVRRYCSPLQALYWLAESGELRENRDLIEAYSLEKLLDRAWRFKDASRLTDARLTKIIQGIKNDKMKNDYVGYQKHLSMKVILQFINEDYCKHKYAFSKEARQVIEDIQDPRWKDFDVVVERLNAPELLDFYIDYNIRYEHRIPRFHRSPRSVINEKYGDCDDLAYFGKTVLTKAGYDVFGRIVGDDRSVCHIGVGIVLEDGSYLLAVNFGAGGNNRMSGPHETLLSLDKALGYGNPYYRKLRRPFNFNW